MEATPQERAATESLMLYARLGAGTFNAEQVRRDILERGARATARMKLAITCPRLWSVRRRVAPPRVTRAEHRVIRIREHRSCVRVAVAANGPPGRPSRPSEGR